MRLTEEYGMLAVLPSSGTSDVLSTLSLMDEQNSCVLFKQQEKSLLLPMLMDTSLLQHEPHWSSFIVWVNEVLHTFVIPKWGLLNSIISQTEWKLWWRKLHQHQFLWSHPTNKSKNHHQPQHINYQPMFSARCGANSNIAGHKETV